MQLIRPFQTARVESTQDVRALRVWRRDWHGAPVRRRGRLPATRSHRQYREDDRRDGLPTTRTHRSAPPGLCAYGKIMRGFVGVGSNSVPLTQLTHLFDPAEGLLLSTLWNWHRRLHDPDGP